MVRIHDKAALVLRVILSPISLSFALSIREAISQRGDLSTLNAISTRFPSILGDLASQGGTLLAPTNNALSSYINDAGIADIGSISEADARDLLSYHSIPISLKSADLTQTGGTIVNTKLMAEAFANLQGQPNVVYASAFGSTGQEQALGNLQIFSGAGAPANVTGSDLAWDSGFLHVIDRVLNYPQPCGKTAKVENHSMSRFHEALAAANLTTSVDNTPKFTCFAPTDAAFAAAGVDFKSLSPKQLKDTLNYHSIVGDVAYSTAVEDGKEYQTLLGSPVTVRKAGGKLLINDVPVERGNVIMSNGVAHLLGGILTVRATATSSAKGASQSSQISTKNSATGLKIGGRIAGVLSGVIISMSSGMLAL
ncbi:FAS1 domain-containing protein [Ephemerocybe angulata]|uniref:FAS1 domain-containing protein n=1 Tax=Ephemerocybe angulata TaxID=980116 RepID=A0A8H6M2Z9_9AGAR|nr:FAS1 domain-containing protein [Tulosesus angulatus]